MEDRDNDVREDDDPAVCPESEIMVSTIDGLLDSVVIFSSKVTSSSYKICRWVEKLNFHSHQKK